MDQRFFDEQEALAATAPDDEITRESWWRTATGHRLQIKDMEDSHLLNCIRCLLHHSPEGTQVYVRGGPERRRQMVSVMATEAYRRGLELLPGAPDGEAE